MVFFSMNVHVLSRAQQNLAANAAQPALGVTDNQEAVVITGPDQPPHEGYFAYLRSAPEYDQRASLCPEGKLAQGHLDVGFRCLSQQLVPMITQIVGQPDPGRVRPFFGRQNGTVFAAFIELRVSLPFIIKQ